MWGLTDLVSCKKSVRRYLTDNTFKLNEEALIARSGENTGLWYVQLSKLLGDRNRFENMIPGIYKASK